jgi:hypothetical protein
MPVDTPSSGDVMVVRRAGDVTASRGEYWPINWSAIWVGVLSALAIALIVSMVAAAVGAHQIGPAGKIVKLGDVGLGALFFGIVGAFFSFVVGGWVAGKINGFRHAETDMLHGAIVWLVAVPMLVALAALGAGALFGAWFGGLAGVPVWVTPSNVAADPNAAAAARNAALFAVTALLVGLIGSVLGGWMASGEAMSIYLRSRNTTTGSVTRRTSADRV